MAEVEKVELEYREWLAQINQKITFIIRKVLDHKDITEDDNDILRVLFKVWRNGEHIIYMTKSPIVVESVHQVSLFTQEDRQEVLTELNGTTLAILSSEPIKEARDEI